MTSRQRAAATIFAANALAVAILPPSLFLALLGVNVAGLAVWFWDAWRAAERRVEALSAELAARGPRLRVVPAPRSEDDYWLTVMRAVEEKR